MEVNSGASAPSGAPASAGSSDASQNSPSLQPQESRPVSPLNGQPVPVSPNQQKKQGAPTDQQKKEAAAARRLKLKIDGQEEELAEDEVIKLAQMGRAADKRFQEAAKSRKEAEQFLRMLKEDPISVLQNPAIGHDFRRLAEEYLKGQYEKEMLSPEQRRIRELEETLKLKDEKEKQDEEQKRQEQLGKLTEHYKQEFDTKIVEALQTSGLPRSPKAVNRMIDYMSTAIREGIDVEPKHVVNLVRRDFINDITDLFSQMEGDSLLQLLGDGVANKIRKADLARLKAAQFQTPGTKEVQPAPIPEPKVKTPLNIYEWRKQIDNRVKE